ARTDGEGLAELEPLWTELHAHHREVAEHRDLVADPTASWAARLRLYRRLLAEGGAYVTATRDGRAIGYAMIGLEEGDDDTFAVTGGVAEVVTLVVAGRERGSGVGAALLAAAEEIARSRGFDTVKIAVMSGNDRAERFYASHGYGVAERVLYRRLAR
ncbi:MAG: GNAT family N-acetyltransferase, partial [Solirubrobacteraceae bacterium]